MSEVGEANVLGLHAQIKANATILFPNQVSNHKGGDKRIPAPEAFTVVVIKASIPSYRAYCLADSDSVAKGGWKSTAVEALRSLLNTLAEALAAKLEEKKRVNEEGNWVRSGEGEVMGVY
ncbi:hypothetical protein LTR15_003717 [Elasticomyces elasticus]|nr:hypothetical protein LTR15_003717 [Elasticomyces elasticus]